MNKLCSLIALFPVLTACTARVTWSAPSLDRGAAELSTRKPAGATEESAAQRDPEPSKAKSKPKPSPERPTETPRPEPAKSAPKAEPKPDPKSCVRAPSILVRQYTGSGGYGPVLHGHDLGLRPTIDIWDRVVRTHLGGAGMTSGSAVPIDCEAAKKIRSDAALLVVIKKKKETPDAWMAVETLPDFDWMVDTNELGQPVGKSKVIVVARRRDAD